MNIYTHYKFKTNEDTDDIFVYQTAHGYDDNKDTEDLIHPFICGYNINISPNVKCININNYYLTDDQENNMTNLIKPNDIFYQLTHGILSLHYLALFKAFPEYIGHYQQYLNLPVSNNLNDLYKDFATKYWSKNYTRHYCNSTRSLALAVKSGYLEYIKLCIDDINKKGEQYIINSDIYMLIINTCNLDIVKYFMTNYNIHLVFKNEIVYNMVTAGYYRESICNNDLDTFKFLINNIGYNDIVLYESLINAALNNDNYNNDNNDNDNNNSEFLEYIISLSKNEPYIYDEFGRCMGSSTTKEESILYHYIKSTSNVNPKILDLLMKLKYTAHQWYRIREITYNTELWNIIKNKCPHNFDTTPSACNIIYSMINDLEFCSSDHLCGYNLFECSIIKSIIFELSIEEIYNIMVYAQNNNINGDITDFMRKTNMQKAIDLILFAVTNSNLQIYEKYIDKHLDIIIKYDKLNECPAFKNLVDNAIDICTNQNVSDDVKEYWHNINYILNN